MQAWIPLLTIAASIHGCHLGDNVLREEGAVIFSYKLLIFIVRCMHFIHTVQCDVELGTRGGPVQRIDSDVSVPPDALCYLHLCCIFGGLCRYSA